MLAQHVEALSRGVITSAAPVLTEDVMGMPFPAGPPTFAVRIIRVNSPAGEAVTRSFVFALINAMKASRTLCSVSISCTV